MQQKCCRVQSFGEICGEQYNKYNRHDNDKWQPSLQECSTTINITNTYTHT